MIDPRAAAGLPETSYGVAKRLQVVSDWVREVSEASGRPRLDILDYGCGTGDHLTAPLAAQGHRVLGVDAHGPSIAVARARHVLPSLTFRTTDVEALASEGLGFDVVICSEVLEHVTHPGQFLADLRKLARDDGAVIITTPNGWGSFELLCSLQTGMRRIGLHQALRQTVWGVRRIMSRLRGIPPPMRPLERLTDDDRVGFINFDSGHVQFFRVRQLERLFAEAGFRVVHRRARTLLCGPYVDAALAIAPARKALLRLNDQLADLLPFSAAADWMFLLRPVR